MTKGGLIISLTNDQSYSLAESKTEGKTNRGMLYDKNYCIYGNAEIRIKFGEKKIFSNFGISNGYFDSRKKKINDLLC
jgi:hypothetical protein